MPPKAVSKPKAKSATDHVTYQDMIIDAIVTLKQRRGSSRVALKKYIKANNENIVDGKMFDSLFNRAIKSGVEKGIFEQPRGSSGGTKLAKKESKSSSIKPLVKPAEPVEPAGDKEPEKITDEKKVVRKKSQSMKKSAPIEVEDKDMAVSKPKTSRIKAPSKLKKVIKVNAVEEIPLVIRRTKSGRIVKSTITPPKIKLAPKKATTTAKSKKIVSSD
ncbi:hypothetical protein K3495_g8963 [Podosphaera aphanis]|nr:hypothetical protein K3495_g8963 [Podosphaera aphanis]